MKDISIVITGDISQLQSKLAAAKRTVTGAFDQMGSGVDLLNSKLGALGAGLSLAGIGALFKGVVDGIDGLNDLADAAGTSVAKVSALEDMAERTGTRFETVTSTLVKFNNVLNTADNGSATERALKAINLDAAELKKLDPADALHLTAQALARYADDGDKARLVQMLFGKSVAEVAPLLKDLAEKSELVGTVTGEQAAEAEKFNRQLFDLQKNAKDAGRALVSDLLPAVNEIFAAFRQGGLRAGLDKLGDELLGWSGNAQSKIIGSLEDDLKGLREQRSLLVKELDFFGAGDRLAAEIDAKTRSLENARAKYFKLTGGAAGGGRGAVNPAYVEPERPGVGVVGEKPVKAALSEYDKLIDKLSKEIPKATAEAEAAQMGYNKAQAEFIALARSPEWANFTPGQREAVAALYATKIASEQAADAAKAETKQIEEQVKARELLRAEMFAQVAAHEKTVVGLQESNQALADEIELIGLSEREQRAILQARAEAVILAKQATLAELERQDAITGTMSRQQIALRAEIELLTERNALEGRKFDRTEAARSTEEMVRGQMDMWQSVDRTAHDVFVDVAKNGMNAFERIGKTLEASVLDVLYQMTVRKWMINIGTSVFGAGFGAAANAATGGGAGGALSTAGGIGNMASLASGIGSFTTAGMLPTGIATALTGSTSSLAMGLSGAWGAGGGMLSTLNAGMSMLGSGSIMSGLGTLAGALGPIALGIAALAAIFGKKATPHAGAASTYSEAGGLVSNADIYRASGLADVRTYNAGVEQVTGNVAKAIGDTLNATARAFGKTAGYEITTAFADDKSKDGAWGSLIIKQMGEAVIDWRDTQTSKWAPKEFADGEAGSKEYLAEAAKSARDALVQAIGSVDWATGMLTGLGDTVSLESLAQTVQQINAAKAAFVGFGQYMPAFASLADSAVSKLVHASGGVDALAGNMSTFVAEFFTEEERLKVATDNVTAELAKLGYQMPRTRDEFKALLQAQLALGDAGADTAAKLLQLTGAVASVTQQSATATAQMQAEASDRRAFVKARREMQEAEQKVQLDAMEASKTAAAELFKSIQDHIKGIDDWLKGALLDTNSLLSPEGKVQEAQAQFDALYARAAGGDADAMGQLTSAASALRDVARDAYASSGAYGSIEMDLRARLAALEAGAFDPNRQRAPQPSGERPAGEALNLAEAMALTGLGPDAASLLTSLNRYDKSLIDSLSGMSQNDALQALLQANRGIALGTDGGANFYKETETGSGQEYLRIALANGSFASAGGGANAGNVYRMGLQLGLTDDEVRQGLGLMGKGAQADTEFWQSNWSEQSSAIGNWVKTSGQGQDTLVHLYELNQQMFQSYKEAVEAIRGSGSAQAQGQAQQIELLQSVDKRLADQAANTRMGAIA